MQQGVAGTAGPLLERASQELVAPVIVRLWAGADELARVLPDYQAVAEMTALAFAQTSQAAFDAAAADEPPAWSLDQVAAPLADQFRQEASGVAQAVTDFQQSLTETAQSLLDRSSPEVVPAVSVEEAPPVTGSPLPGGLARALTDAQQAATEQAASLLEGATQQATEAKAAGSAAAEAGPGANPLRRPADELARSLTDLRQSFSDFGAPLLERSSRQAAEVASAAVDTTTAPSADGIGRGMARAAAEMQQAIAGKAAPVLQRTSRAAAEQGVAVDAPVADSLRPGSNQLSQALEALQQKAAPVLERTSQEVRDKAPVMAAKVAADVGAGVEAAAPVVRAQLEALAKSGYEVAAPLAKSGFDAAAPLVKSGFAAVRSGLESTGNAAGSALSRQLTPDQLASVEQAGRVATKIGRLTGTAAKGALELGGKAVTAAAPVVGRLAADGFAAGTQALQAGAAVMVESAKSLAETGQLPDGTVRGIGAAAEQGSRGLMRGAASGFRSAASLLDDTPTPPAPAGPWGLPSLPPLRQVTDQLATSVVRASAPYVLGLGVAGVALAALREVAEPVEKVRAVYSFALGECRSRH
jgi:hypothetical protein